MYYFWDTKPATSMLFDTTTWPDDFENEVVVQRRLKPVDSPVVKNNKKKKIVQKLGIKPRLRFSTRLDFFFDFSRNVRKRATCPITQHTIHTRHRYLHFVTTVNRTYIMRIYYYIILYDSRRGITKTGWSRFRSQIITNTTAHAFVRRVSGSNGPCLFIYFFVKRYRSDDWRRRLGRAYFFTRRSRLYENYDNTYVLLEIDILENFVEK